MNDGSPFELQVRQASGENEGMTTPTTPTPLVVLRASVMTEAQYDAERAELRRLYGNSDTGAIAKRDQSMALLFHRSGWTQEQLATKERMSQPWVVYRLRFGRFLNFTATVIKSEFPLKDLTERGFREYWARTDRSETNERKRFTEVLRLIEDGPATTRRSPIGKPIVQKFADGKWHKPETVARAINQAEDHVATTLERMRKNQTYGAKCERRHAGKGFEYRIYKQEKMISSSELVEKLTPIIKDLKAEGRKNMATMSPATVGYLAGMLEKLVEEWVG